MRYDVSNGPALSARVLYTEFNRFQEDFEARRSNDDDQWLRGEALLWWACFARELFPKPLIDEIMAFLRNDLDAKDHRYHGWVELGSLYGVLAVYFFDAGWLVELVANLAHHSRGTRRDVATRLALAAPCISCCEPDLIESVQRNFECAQLCANEALAIYVASAGTAATKRAQVARWADRFASNVSGHDDLVALLETGRMANPFHGWMSQLHRYLAVRHVTAWLDMPVQLLEGEGGRAPEPRSDFAATVWRRMMRHPLVDGDVKLADVRPAAWSGPSGLHGPPGPPDPQRSLGL